MPGHESAIRDGLPAEQAVATQLRQEGVLEAIYVAGAGRVWMIMKGDSETGVRAAVERFPLHPHLAFDFDELIG